MFEKTQIMGSEDTGTDFNLSSKCSNPFFGAEFGLKGNAGMDIFESIL